MAKGGERPERQTMNQYFYHWDELEAEDHGLSESLCRIKMITGEKLQLIRAVFQPGGTYETHSHPHEQFSFMVRGALRLRVGDCEKLVGPGDIWHVPPDVVHGGDILGDEPVIFVDVFHPVREEVIEEMARRRAERRAGDEEG